jgi:choline dehydrogenase-like flavoprotein
MLMWNGAVLGDGQMQSTTSFAAWSRQDVRSRPGFSRMARQGLALFRTAEFAPREYLRCGLGAFWHQCGTARRGKDPLTSAVDRRPRVYVLEGLRVADGSGFRGGRAAISPKAFVARPRGGS